MNSTLSRAEMKRVFMKLDINVSDVDRVERMADVDDFKIQAVRVLQFWASSKGEKATKKAFYDAIAECRLGTTKEEEQQSKLSSV